MAVGILDAMSQMVRMRSPATKNAVSSFVSLFWLNALSVLAIPVYVKLLGTGSWGIVAACSSLQLLFTFIDLGFSQIVPRWVAREANSPSLLRQYIRVFQMVYGALAVTGFVVIQAAAWPLGHLWFNVPSDQAGTLVLCIRLIAFQLLFQFANNLYVGIWHGLQLQVQANLRTCLFGTLKHAVAILALVFVAANPVLYALMFAAVALAELATSVVATRRRGLLASASDASTAPLETRLFFREAAVLSIGIIVGLGVSQMDRIVLSRIVSVDSFGVYVVVFNLAMAFLALQAPLTRAYFPVLVQDVKLHGRPNPATLKRLVVGNTLVCILPALAVAACADKVLRLWVHNEHFVELGTLPLRLLLVATCFNVLYNCFYQVIVAQGSAHVVLKLNLACLAVGVATAAVFAGRADLMVGGLIWIATTSTQLALGIAWYWSSTRHANRAPESRQAP